MTQDPQSVRNMNVVAERIEPVCDDAAAYATHYTGHDPPKGLHSHLEVMSSCPGTKEAGYARSQVRNIITATVPDQELLSAQVKLEVVRSGRRGGVGSDEHDVHR